jgi:hypothetical protein
MPILISDEIVLPMNPRRQYVCRDGIAEREKTFTEKIILEKQLIADDFQSEINFIGSAQNTLVFKGFWRLCKG